MVCGLALLSSRFALFPSVGRFRFASGVAPAYCVACALLGALGGRLAHVNSLVAFCVPCLWCFCFLDYYCWLILLAIVVGKGHKLLLKFFGSFVTVLFSGGGLLSAALRFFFFNGVFFRGHSLVRGTPPDLCALLVRPRRVPLRPLGPVLDGPAWSPSVPVGTAPAHPPGALFF